MEKKEDTVNEEIADVIIYLLELGEILNLNIEEELIKKVNKKLKIEYKIIDNVLNRTKDFSKK